MKRDVFNQSNTKRLDKQKKWHSLDNTATGVTIYRNGPERAETDRNGPKPTRKYRNGLPGVPKRA